MPSGKGAGRPFQLREWQKDFIFDIYANSDGHGDRKTRRAILSMARKNGKTALIAALVLVHLCGPEAYPNTEIVSAANDREQAAIVFKYAAQMVRLSPILADMLSIVESKKRIVWHDMGSVYAATSADAKRKHGLNPGVVIYDELAQSISRDLFDALETSQGAQEAPLFVTISTQSNDPQHPLSQMIDDGLVGGDEATVVHLYEVPMDVEDIWSEEVWYSANPALDDFRFIAEMRDYAAKARRLPSFENTFRNLYLNQRVSHHLTLFSHTVWRKRAEPDRTIERGERVYLGLDLATRVDLAALSMFSEAGHLRCFFWKPEQLLDVHGDRDHVDYREWWRQGWLEPCPGKAIDPQVIAQKIVWAVENFEVVGLAYDRHRMETIERELVRMDVDASEDQSSALWLVKWGQGFVGMSPAIEAFEELVIDDRLTHEANPILTWCVGNAVIHADAAGNRKFDKEKSRMRIDGAVSSAMAVGLREKLKTEDEGPSVYETRGLVRI